MSVGITAAVALAVLATALAAASDPRRSAPTTARRADVSRVPIAFVANQGRWDPRAAWVASGRDATAFFVDGGVRWAVGGDGGRPGWALDQVLVGARAAKPTASVPAPGIVSYFTGAHGQSTALPTANELTIAQAWPGIDVVWSGAAGSVETTYRLAPGADPARIRVAWRGADRVELTAGGRLAVTTPVKTVEEDAPRAWQDVDGRRVPVDVAFVPDGSRSYGFRLGRYDRSRALVIDPTVLLYASFLGGSNTDEAKAIAVDSGGNTYVAGTTVSDAATFPETPGAFQPDNGGLADAFVAKVNPTATTLLYASFLGGSDNEDGVGLAVDAAGNAYVTGLTGSKADTFPVAGPVFQPQSGGEVDAFVTKVNPTGSALVYSGFFGGSGDDNAYAIALGAAGDVYLTGATESEDLPLTPGAFQTAQRGEDDSFVAHISASGSTLLGSSYLGGTQFDFGFGIAVDGGGNAYVAGFTNTDDGTFPVTAGVFQPTFAGAEDTFITKVNPTATTLIYSSYLGGAGRDEGKDVAVDGAGNAYVVGATESVAPSFPVTPGVYQPQNRGDVDAFVTKVNPSGSALVFSTFLGGTDLEGAAGVALDSARNVYLTGPTTSTSFPVTFGVFQPKYGGGTNDGFVAKLNASGTSLLYSSFIGGDDIDQGNAIAVDAVGTAYIAGGTNSTAATFPATFGVFQARNGGVRDAFVAKVATVDCAAPPPPFAIVGTARADVINGTPGNDVIFGLGAADKIDGRGGSDLICGGEGSDLLIGGDGNDTLDGGPGSNYLLGGAGDDALIGGSGANVLDGGAGTNRCQRGSGRTVVRNCGP